MTLKTTTSTPATQAIKFCALFVSPKIKPSDKTAAQGCDATAARTKNKKPVTKTFLTNHKTTNKMKKSIVAAIILGVILGSIASLTPIFAQDWKPNPKYIKTDTSKTSEKPAFQCMGTTQKGLRCKHHVKANGDYCSQHQQQKNG